MSSSATPTCRRTARSSAAAASSRAPTTRRSRAGPTTSASRLRSTSTADRASRVRLAPFRLHRPRTLEDATAVLDELGPEALPYCGGTELLLVAKLGLTDF